MILIISLVILCNLSCELKRSKLERTLTNDSIQYWDAIILGKNGNKPFTTYSFDIYGRNERYDFRKTDDQRYLIPYLPKKNELGMSNSFRVIDDNIIEVLGCYKWEVSRYNDDSIFFSSKNNSINFFLLRVNKNPNINKESIRYRDSIYRSLNLN